MGAFGADYEELQELSLQLHDIGAAFRSITQEARTSASRVAQNPSLRKLGYAGMIREAGAVLEKGAGQTEELSRTLEDVAHKYELYESKVLGAPFEDAGTNAQPGSAARNPFWDFLMGDMEAEGSMASRVINASGEFLGIAASGAVGGELLGAEASLKPELVWDVDKGDIYGGVKGEAEFYGARGYAEGDFGLLHGEAEIKAGTVATEGELGASLFRDGRFDPSLRAKAEARASAISGEIESRLGTEDTNVHAEAKGDLMTAHAEVSAYAGKDGLGLKAEAGAYAAEGEISGGFNFMGLKVDVGLEGKAGGAGAEIGFGAHDGVVEGSLGIGLGLGAGVNFKIDASGVPKAIENWWNGLFE